MEKIIFNYIDKENNESTFDCGFKVASLAVQSKLFALDVEFAEKQKSIMDKHPGAREFSNKMAKIATSIDPETGSYEIANISQHLPMLMQESGSDGQIDNEKAKVELNILTMEFQINNLKAILNTQPLQTIHKEAVLSDISSDFWQNQDMLAIREAVVSFRSKMQGRK